MFDVRLRLAGDDGTRGRVLPTLTLSVTGVGATQARFTVSEKVAGALEDPFLVLVEYSTGGPYASPRKNLLIASKASAEKTDPAQAVAFTAVGFLEWLMARMYVQGTETSGMQRTWPDATPGLLVRAVINHAKATGWGPHVAMDFTDTHDSNGVAWTAADRSSIQWRVGTSMNQVLENLVDQGKAEYWTQGTTLRLFRPGTGADLSDRVQVGATGIERAPHESTFDNVFTHLTVFMDDDAFVNLTNTGASARFGALWSTMSQSGVKTAAEAIALAQPAMTLGRARADELSFDWVVTDSTPRPWADFHIGDVVMARTRQGRKPLRVVGLDVSKDVKGVVRTRVVVGSKLLGLVAKLAAKVGPASMGQLTGGNGSPLPSAPGPAAVTPMAPTGLRVESNVGSWRPDGSAVTSVVLAWNAVTQATDLSALDVTEYEIAARRASGTSAVIAATSSLSLPAEWEPDGTWYVKVRAKGHSGQVSDWSDEIPVTPEMPASIVPKPPTGLSLVSNTGAFQQDGTAISTITLGWTPVTLSVDGKAVTVPEYEVLYGLESVRVRAASATITIPAGKQVQVTVRPLSSIGVWGDPSAALPVTGALPAASTVAPSAPAVVAGMGGVSYRWDGLSSTGAAMPAGTASVVVETAPAATGPWTAQGAPLTNPGGGTIAGTVGTTVHVRFRAFDTLGRAMGTSTTASAVPAGVPVKDVPGLSGELNGIRYTADGNNRVYVSVTEPDRHRGTNRYIDPAFTDGSYAPWSVVNGGLERTGTATQSGTYVGASEIPVAPGDRFQVTATRQNLAGGTGTASIYAQRKSAAGVWSFWATLASLTAAGITSGGWATVPADTVAIRFGFFTETNMPATTKVRIESLFLEKARSGDLWMQLDPTGASVVAVKVWDGTAWAPQVLYADSILAAESITSLLIKAGAIEVNHVSPAFGDSLNIGANASINLLAGRADSAATALTAHQAALDNQAAGILEAQSAADAAATGANAANLAAAAAQAAAARAQMDVDKLSLAVSITPTDVRISRPGAPVALHLSNDQASFRRNGVAQTWWDENQMIVPKLKASQVIVGRTVITEGSGRTTWQRL